MMPIFMESIPATVILVAAVSSVTMAVVVLARRRPQALHWSFGLGMLGFAAEAVASYMLATTTETPAEHRVWLDAVLIAGLLLPVPWAFFVALLRRTKDAVLPATWRLSLGVLSIITLAASAGVLMAPAFDLFDTPGRFYAARLEVMGRYAAIVAILTTVAILGGLEACLHATAGTSRWRLKYLVLGLGGIFLVRFYLLSQQLLFGALMADYLTTSGATLLLGSVAVGVSLARDRLKNLELTVSREMVYRSIVVGVLGLYLLVVGGLGWAMTLLGVPEELFWGSLVVFVSALGLAAVLLSEDVRWRIKRYVGQHVYRTKYDYRTQWISFTKRLGSVVTPDDLARHLVAAVAEAVGTTTAALYLLDSRDGRYHAVTVGGDGRLPALTADAPLVTRLRTEQQPQMLTASDAAADPILCAEVRAVFPDATIAVPLHWRSELMGMMLIGPERSGSAYGFEDLEFLATVAEQAAGALATARLSESVAQSREFEAFHRLTSFVIHDVKNSISALSLLSQNALANFDDPEFQRDAIRTVSRTVDRMRALLARLSSAPGSSGLQFQPVDLCTLAADAVAVSVKSPRVTLHRELQRVPAVSADPDALLRVIQNLITNAVEAMDGEGAITLRTFVDRDAAVIAVSDTGCGISEEFLRTSLFAPFRSTKKGGWGIGLYQAKAIVEGHGGTIEVASKEGDGTTFSVRLPILEGRPDGSRP